MAKRDEFFVAPGRTIRRKDGAKFGEGTEISADVLGVDKKAFDSLLKDGIVVRPERKSLAPKDDEPDGDPKGDEKSDPKGDEK